MDVRISEKDLHASTFGKNFVTMHFASLIICHGLAEGGRLTVEYGGEAVDDSLGGGVVHLGQHDKAGRAFDQCADR